MRTPPHPLAATIGFGGLVLTIWLAFGPALATAAPVAELWERWTAHDPTSTRKIDHVVWDDFLLRFRTLGPDGIARVDYGAVLEEDHAILASYIDQLAETAVSTLARPEQFAFWVNLYNALTVKVVLDAYPVDTIRDIDISPGLLSNGPWGKELVKVEGEDLSLDDIEHRILRPIWRDPRMHYVVNCASIGCPNLPEAALTAETVEAELDAASRAFVNHPRAVRVEQDGLRVSSIYHWFKEDFGGDDAGVIAHLRRYADGPLAEAMGDVRSISGHGYDWALNDAATAATQ